MKGGTLDAVADTAEVWSGKGGPHITFHDPPAAVGDGEARNKSIDKEIKNLSARPSADTTAAARIAKLESLLATTVTDVAGVRREHAAVVKENTELKSAGEHMRRDILGLKASVAQLESKK